MEGGLEMVDIDEVSMCCYGLLSKVVILHSSIFNWMILSFIKGWFFASVD